ncbi:hypothetical protein DV737_g4968, partial [Chaetothyriales sp. CBS 132003]
MSNPVEPSPNLDTDPKAYTAPLFSESPYSTTSPYGESPIQSSYYSSPDLANVGFDKLCPKSLLQEDLDYEEDEDYQGGKPYARLIYEALLEAPGHRMMLRDIYKWFEKNTTKPRESGTNGWQNSIRHNLSMNHAFENDKSETKNARADVTFDELKSQDLFLSEHLGGTLDESWFQASQIG